MSLIKLKDINKTYYTLAKETKALDNINFSIEDGEIIGIIGPSGCGKSTILNIITGLDNDYEGEIIIDKNINIGYMMQNEACLPWLKNIDNATLGLKLKNIYNKDSLNYTKFLFNKYGLNEFMTEYPKNLSGGMKQRLSLIRTLAIKPNILLLDEPFSKLDLENKIKISNDVYNIIREEKIATLLISHDIKEVINLSDKIIILSSRPGKVLLEIDNVLKEIAPCDRYNNEMYDKIKLKIEKVLNYE